MEGFTTSMVETVEQFETEATSLSCGAFAACPDVYRENPDPTDPINAAWNEVTVLTARAMNAVEVLGDLLRKEDGVAGPGPTAEFFADGTDEKTAETKTRPDANGSAKKAQG